MEWWRDDKTLYLHLKTVFGQLSDLLLNELKGRDLNKNTFSVFPTTAGPGKGPLIITWLHQALLGHFICKCTEDLLLTSVF